MVMELVPGVVRVVGEEVKVVVRGVLLVKMDRDVVWGKGREEKGQAGDGERGKDMVMERSVLVEEGEEVAVDTAVVVEKGKEAERDGEGLAEVEPE